MWGIEAQIAVLTEYRKSLKSLKSLIHECVTVQRRVAEVESNANARFRGENIRQLSVGADEQPKSSS